MGEIAVSRKQAETPTKKRRNDCCRQQANVSSRTTNHEIVVKSKPHRLVSPAAETKCKEAHVFGEHQKQPNLWETQSNAKEALPVSNEHKAEQFGVTYTENSSRAKSQAMLRTVQEKLDRETVPENAYHEETYGGSGRGSGGWRSGCKNTKFGFDANTTKHKRTRQRRVSNTQSMDNKNKVKQTTTHLWQRRQKQREQSRPSRRIRC